MTKKLVCVLLIFCFALSLMGCEKIPNPVVTMEFEDGRKATIELLPDVAPNTVANFVTLIESGFYDGLTFHRVSRNAIVQGGDPKGDGSGGPGYTIKGEFYANDQRTKNFIGHERGVISMARLQEYDSAGSQFFVVVDDQYSEASLDGYYAAFGYVIEGLEIFDEIAQMETDEYESLVKPVVIKKMTVDTDGRVFKVKKITE